MSNNPPKWAMKFFKWFCNDHLAEGVLGDMLELYDRRRAEHGKRKADILFIWNVIQFIQPFAFRKKSKSYSLNNFDMIQNYFKIAWRNMSRQKMYSAITIIGFALGLATCMMITLFIKNELNFDKHYKEGSRVYRIYNDFSNPTDRDRFANIQTPLIGVIKEELPDVQSAARLMNSRMGNGTDNLLRRDDAIDNIYEQKFAYADAALLDILEIPMVFGKASSALIEPFTMVISRRKAKQYFGDEDPIGKVMIIEEDRAHPYTIGGVMEDYREDSHFQYDFLLTLSGFEFWEGEQTNWCCWNYEGYIKLRDGVDKLEFEKKLITIRDKYVIGYIAENQPQSIEEFKQYHFYKLQSISDIHLQPEVSDQNDNGDPRYTWIFGGIAVFILTLACINFINLSTARSANRAKEVGLRKVVGSFRKYLIAQFLSESVLYSFISFAIAVLLVIVLLPTFNAVANRNITIPWTEWSVLPILVSEAIIIGILAGLYPSFYLSSFKPIDVLKGKLSLGSRSSTLRSGMVVFQFTTSIILIVGTLIINRQMKYMMTKDLGFKKDQMLLLEGVGPLNEKREVLNEEILRIPGVENASVSGYLPVTGTQREGYAFSKEGFPNDRPVNAQKWRVDPQYIATMHMEMVEGRDFIKDMASDSQAVIINQAMAAQLDFKEKTIGSKINNGTVYTIIGVVQDFHFSSMKAPIRPLCMVLESGFASMISIRVNSDDMQGIVQAVESKWKQVAPNQPFRYSFLDDRFVKMYDDVQRTGSIFTGFATLAIIVACLGLFALSAFMTEQRNKEIGIRLVLGASVQNIFRLLTGNFVVLVVLSILIATPLAWYGMVQWLKEFEYKVPLTVDVFVVAGLVGLVIAVLTVSYQSIRAGLTRSVETLKNS